MFSTRDIHSPSPYPISSPCSSDSEDESSFTSTSLKSSIASLSEARLRAILNKLADTNPRFQQVISREVAQYHVTHTEAPITPITPTTPTNNRQRRKRRRTSRRRNTKLAQHPDDAHQIGTQILYHPGQIVEEVYEFLSASPHERHDPCFQVVRAIKMWSCCDEDEWSDGCRSVPVFPYEVGYGTYQDNVIEFGNSDILLDSEVERR